MKMPRILIFVWVSTVILFCWGYLVGRTSAGTSWWLPIVVFIIASYVGLWGNYYFRRNK